MCTSEDNTRQYTPHLCQLSTLVLAARKRMALAKSRPHCHAPHAALAEKLGSRKKVNKLQIRPAKHMSSAKKQDINAMAVRTNGDEAGWRDPKLC